MKWEKQLRINYFAMYRGILPEKAISDSADWMIEFISHVIEKAKKEYADELIEEIIPEETPELNRNQLHDKLYHFASGCVQGHNTCIDTIRDNAKRVMDSQYKGVER